jgi:carboxyl-terminal processing protease
LFFQSIALGQSGNSSKLTAKNESISTKSDQTGNRPLTIETLEQDMAEALTIIQDNYIDGKKLDYNEVFKSSIEGMLHTLDPHSNYFDAKEFEQFRTEQRSEYFGIGATIGDLRDANTVSTYIRATFEGAPAHRAGLRYGDKIVEVNGVSMRNKTFTEVRSFLRGPRGTTAKVTVERHGLKELKTFDIIRDAVPQPSIPEYYMLRPGVGYIAMTGGFNQTTASEFREAMKTLKEQNLEALVLDLRGNGGGLVMQAIQVAKTFLPRGQIIFTQRGRIPGSSGEYKSDNSNPENVPIVVLVNGGTASASEILSGALQDHDRALIVGETTFGKGLVQNPYLIEYGSALLLTIAKYQTPSGREIQRDYSKGNLYDYYTNGGTLRDEKKNNPQNGNQTRTDTGRIVYGGGGITPDEIVKPATLSPIQAKLNDPVFAFALDLSFGKVPGFESYKVDRAIEFGRDLKQTDFVMTNELFNAFKKFVAARPYFKFTPAQLDKERAHIERQLRFELATAAFGTTTSFQVYNESDPQISKAIELIPRARELAQLAKQAQNTKQTPFK